MKFGDYPKVSSFKTTNDFKAYLNTLGLNMPCDEVVASDGNAPLKRPITVLGKTLTNRFAVLPMEGWDGLPDGRPSDNTRRRWQHFGQSGAQLIWGGEAVAVRPDGRANPLQLMLNASTEAEIAGLRDILIAAHPDPTNLLIGLQLTHSGRFCRPNDKIRLEPKILYHHPILDRKFNTPPDLPVMTDGEISQLIEDFVIAAKRVRNCGFDFVDLKHCHGYLGHEFLSAVHRPGRYGGSLENRTRFLRELVDGVRSEAPGLEIGVRVSAIDLIPFRPDPELSNGTLLGPGTPEPFAAPYVDAFGADPEDPANWDISQPLAFVDVMRGLGIKLLNITLASPYYNPHVTRPALYPPSDGYLPPEEPLVGVMRLLEVARQIKAANPDMICVGSGYTYLQDFLPNVAQAVVDQGWIDFVGLGRMMLSYPELPRDVLEGRPMQHKKYCRTFSDCTTAPRNGMVSGCYPLDAFYKKSPEFRALAAVKKAAKLT
jgi:2,4-dienoyl-CoA reductase-like NADH-dependent reductase (Old Yellow Enzyme family)